MPEADAQMRWDPYVLVRDDEFDSFWRDHLKGGKRKVLLIIGRGFDPRALEAARRLKDAGTEVNVWLLAFDNGLEDSPLRSELTDKNLQGLQSLFSAGMIQEVDIRIGGSTEGNATSRNTRFAIEAAGDCGAFDDVIVDISAMPRMVALTAVAKLIHDLDEIQDETGKVVNLHVITAESVSTDIGAAEGSLSDVVTYVFGFSGHLTAQATELVPRVWFPILGEGQRDRLLIIKDVLDPDEICPVVPFPTKHPRRGDQIIDEHRDILFEDFQIEPPNILHACEYNPFEAYKQLFAAMDRYRMALKELEGCKAFVSPVSSKLLSIGALLACYDHQNRVSNHEELIVGIPYVETAVYGDPSIASNEKYDLYSMWIRGEWEE